jgi:HAD superfamily hydrolase (TIGR01548 family)
LIEDYLQKQNILVKKDKFPILDNIDVIIFDVDGVLVNVSDSFHKSAIDTVQYYFSNIIKISGKEELVDRQLINSFKLAGGFNDDWELTAAAILYYLWKMKQSKLNTLEELKDSPPTIDKFIGENLSTGDGLSQLHMWIKENASDPDEIFSSWDKEKIFQIAKEFYAGKKYCYRLYNFYPEFIKKDNGNIERETILINPEAIQILKNYNIGILTGRDKAETRYILNKIGWESFLKPEMIITSQDNKKKKPSPEGLKYLLDISNSKTGLYIGDTMADLLTVKSFNKQRKKQQCLFSLILDNKFAGDTYQAQKENFLGKGVDFLAENVNQIISLVHNKN